MSSLSTTTVDAEALLAKARQAQQTADRNKAQADVVLEQLRGQLQTVVSDLKTMGYNSPKDAQEDAVKLREEATEALTDALAKLQGVN